MSIKLEGNGLWESSRMIMPEHRVKMVEDRRKLNVRKRPTLAEDEIEAIERLISESFAEKTAITLILFDEYEDCRAVGVVQRIDSGRQRVMIDGDWFALADVIGAYRNN